MKKILTTLVLGLAVLGLSNITLTPERWVNPRLFPGTVLEATYTPTPVKSITQVAIVFTGAASNTAVVSVTAANSLLINQGFSADDVNPWACAHSARGTITNGTTITATRGCATSNGTYRAVVVEFLGNFVKSQACTTIAIGDSAVTATSAALSPAVVVAKTVVASTGASNIYPVGSGVAGANFTSQVELTSTTAITATREFNPAGTAIGHIAGACYVEFK